MTETKIMRQIQVLASRIGTHLFRNSVGRWQDAAGNWINYGLANPGGSDLIGWRRVTITQEMVGTDIAQFVAIEVKTPVGKLSKEQRAFLQIVRECGGFGITARSPEDALTGLAT